MQGEGRKRGGSGLMKLDGRSVAFCFWDCGVSRCHLMAVLRHKDGVRDHDPGRRNCLVFKH